MFLLLYHSKHLIANILITATECDRLRQSATECDYVCHKFSTHQSEGVEFHPPTTQRPFRNKVAFVLISHTRLFKLIKHLTEVTEYSLLSGGKTICQLTDNIRQGNNTPAIKKAEVCASDLRLRKTLWVGFIA